MAIAVPVGTTAEATGLARQENRERRLLALRLPQTDINVLRFVFGGLESMMGVGSNFGRMVDRMQGVTYTTASQLEPMESWACWGHHTAGSLSCEVDHARLALIYMAKIGCAHEAGVLYRMYAGITPARFYTDYAELGDLVPLALETDTVTMTASHRQLTLLASLESCRRHKDLLGMIRAQAHGILIKASHCYRYAKAAT